YGSDDSSPILVPAGSGQLVPVANTDVFLLAEGFEGCESANGFVVLAVVDVLLSLDESFAVAAVAGELVGLVEENLRVSQVFPEYPPQGRTVNRPHVAALVP